MLATEDEPVDEPMTDAPATSDHDEGRPPTPPLIDAAIDGDIEALTQLLAESADVCAETSTPQHPCTTPSRLHLSFTFKKHFCLAAQVESSDSDAWTALMAASLNGQTEAVMLLLKAGARVGAQDKDGWSALSYAAQEGNLPIVRLLLESGAPVNSVTDDGWTTLHFASREGHVDVLSALAAAGAPLGATTEGASAANVPASYTTVACVPPPTHESRSRALALVVWTEGWTPLMLASREGHVLSIRALCDAGADVHALDSCGQSALSYASGSGQVDAIEALVLAGADVKASVAAGQVVVEPRRSSSKKKSGKGGHGRRRAAAKGSPKTAQRPAAGARNAPRSARSREAAAKAETAALMSIGS